MESRVRLIVKAATWQALGLISMTLIGFLVTGSATQGGVVAMSGAVTGFVCYILHEGVWNRVRWGRKGYPQSFVVSAGRDAA